MYYQLLELYSSCRCLYYQHAVDRCDAYGRPGHTVQLRTILVGYACLNHTYSHGQSHDSDSARSKATSSKTTSGIITENFIEKYFQRAAELGCPGLQLMSTSEQRQGPLNNMKSDSSVGISKAVSHPGELFPFLLRGQVRPKGDRSNC
ncbi:hypothetical protein CLIM01_04715 [Colletotrichum limetticola]|uniref:Uncharacterized protein n=1 Tax=Colletotrichum limetticola TaxID=1209924 RepID=A0ABQ9Q2J3_9PEZI|nr:hypothetical protein CLIM01_04715 [Colletotrichum limetticola]